MTQRTQADQMSNSTSRSATLAPAQTLLAGWRRSPWDGGSRSGWRGTPRPGALGGVIHAATPLLAALIRDQLQVPVCLVVAESEPAWQEISTWTSDTRRAPLPPGRRAPFRPNRPVRRSGAAQAGHLARAPLKIATAGRDLVARHPPTNPIAGTGRKLAKLPCSWGRTLAFATRRSPLGVRLSAGVDRLVSRGVRSPGRDHRLLPHRGPALASGVGRECGRWSLAAGSRIPGLTGQPGIGRSHPGAGVRTGQVITGASRRAAWGSRPVLLARGR